MELLSLEETTTLKNGVRTNTITAVVDGEDGVRTLSFNDSHHSWGVVVELTKALVNNEITEVEYIERLDAASNLAKLAEEEMIKTTNLLDGRVSVHGGKVYIDHEPIDPVLEEYILRLLERTDEERRDDEWVSFQNFLNNLYSNVSEYVRQQLFGWLRSEVEQGTNFALTPDGCFIGYKGCQMIDSIAHSINTGTAIVNGERKSGQIPNPLGAIVEMPRSKVQYDPSIGCASGLHVGTYSYASSFARGVILTVKVNPRDVVSVPTECASQKIRTCRYEVIEFVEVPYTEPVFYEADYDDDYCDCGDCYCENCECECDDCMNEGYDDEYSDSDDYSSADYVPRHGTGVVPDETVTFEMPHVGDRVRVVYRRDAATENHYNATVVGLDALHLNLFLHETGDYRTLLLSKVVSVESLPPLEAGETEYSPFSIADDKKSTLGKVEVESIELRTDDLVKLTYLNFGTEATNDVHITSVGKEYVSADLLNGGGSILIQSADIIRIERLEMPKVEDDLVEDLLSIASEELATLGKLIQGTPLESLLEVLKPIFTGDEPTDDIDEEIRRNGYHQE